MIRERALQVVLIVVGLLFLAGLYLVVRPPFKDETFQMMLSLYVTLGIFLILAARNPAAHRSLISFAAWSNLAHAGMMTSQVYRGLIHREELVGSAVFAVIGIILIALAPPKTAPTATAG